MAYTPTAPLSSTATRSVLVSRAQAAAPADIGATPIITAVTFGGSADSPVITIEGAGFGSVPTANPPGCAFIPNNGFDYGSDLALYDFNASHSFYAGGGSSCIGFVNLSYSDTQISYQFGAGYSDYRTLYTLGQGDSYSVGVKGASWCGTVDYNGQSSPNTCPASAATATPPSTATSTPTATPPGIMSGPSTDTPSATAQTSATSTPTATAIPSPTDTATDAPTNTPTDVPTATATPGPQRVIVFVHGINGDAKAIEARQKLANGDDTDYVPLYDDVKTVPLNLYLLLEPDGWHLWQADPSPALKAQLQASQGQNSSPQP